MEVARKGRTVRFEISIWSSQNGSIHIAASDPDVKIAVPDFHSTVNDRLGSRRRHRNLYRKLHKLLKSVGKI